MAANKNKKVLVAMSGGIDSSLSAYLLKEEGYEVTGVTMCFGVEEPGGQEVKEPGIPGGKEPGSLPRCCGRDASEDARNVCSSLGIAHYVLDFSLPMKEKVIDKFVKSYMEGKTPNPCIDCNRFLKFGILFEKAIQLGFDFIATGHYAEIAKIRGKYFLKKPADTIKDQTYFLYTIDKTRLSRIIFPLAGYKKSQVREIARKINLPVAHKKESQEICFVFQKNIKSFLDEFSGVSSYLPGDIVDMEGKVLGKHEGILSYTIGQRKGLGISSRSPLYIIEINASTNTITLGERKYLKSKGLLAGEINLLCDGMPSRVTAKIRYNHPGALCNLEFEENRVKVIFDEEQEAITPGQSIVFYQDDTVLGGGVISQPIKV